MEDQITFDRDELKQLLADCYRKNPLAVAIVCDEVLDRSGALLGDVREVARKRSKMLNA